MKLDLLRRKLISAGLSEKSADTAVRIFQDHFDEDVEIAALRPLPYRDCENERYSNLSLFWYGIKQQIFERDDFTCFYCKADVSDDPTCDHIVARSKGGGIEPENLITACRSCNASKGNRDVNEWLQERAAYAARTANRA